MVGLSQSFLDYLAYAFANGEALNEWVQENAIVINSEDEASLVGITENEKWFVVLIDFPDQNENSNCNQQRASNLIDDSAKDHIRQAFGQSVSWISTIMMKS